MVLDPCCAGELIMTGFNWLINQPSARPHFTLAHFIRVGTGLPLDGWFLISHLANEFYEQDRTDLVKAYRSLVAWKNHF